MIKFIKNDYKMVTEALGYLVGKKIPFGIGLLYYIIVGAIALPFVPLAYLWKVYSLWRFNRMFER